MAVGIHPNDSNAITQNLAKNFGNTKPKDHLFDKNIHQTFFFYLFNTTLKFTPLY